ncbi:hypothetical protein ES703_26299 [subsurface metagenome]
MSQFSIIRQEQKALTVIIQPSHMKHPFFQRRQQLFNRGPLEGILECDQISGRLVEHQIGHPFSSLHGISLDINLVLLIVDLGAQCLDHPAVDLDLPLSDQFIHFSPGGHSRLREELIQPDPHPQYSFPRR